MRVFVLGSGSSGNALLVEAKGTRVLVDAGVGPRAVFRRMEALGFGANVPRFDAIVATHEHGDHFAHAERLAHTFGAPVLLHDGIRAERVRRRAPVTRYEIGRSFHVGSIAIEARIVPHDAPQVALRLDDGTHALGVATDIGRPTPALVSLLASCDAALVESNHCPEMLADGPYPERLKRRVAGGLGHLSNQQTAELARKLVGSRLGRLFLGHLSKINNTPERALEVVASAARRIDVEVLPHGAVCAFDVRSTRPHQLALAFDQPGVVKPGLS
jgi:phosphoribosyl 1,2-cyclic phosphodiesterase